MKKLLIIVTLCTLFILLWYGESRKFFCLENGRCVTVWKTYNNICYIIPGKYYGVLFPTNNYLKSSNTNNLTIFFANKDPDVLIFKSEQKIQVNNTNKEKLAFYNYSTSPAKFDSVLYYPNAKKNNDVKENIEMIDIFVEDNFALNKKGQKL